MSEPLSADELNALMAQDPAAGAVRLHAQARAGDAGAQALYGQLLLDGRGVERDAVEALYWFQEAAHRDVPIAMNMVGRCYENGWGTGIDYDLAATWFKRAAEHGLDWGIYNYAHALANGRGVVQDQAMAFEWFGRAAAAGHARAMYFLGHYYEHGWSVAVDLNRAFELYERAAALGDYRGRCCWASVLAGRGRIDEAAQLLQRAIPDAPAHFLAPLADALEASPHQPLRDIAGEIRTRSAHR